MNDAKTECEHLLGQLMPFIEKMLAENHEFFPIGAAMLQSEEIELVSADEEEEEQPESDELIAILNECLREGAANGDYRATCVAFDALAAPPGDDDKQDTIICTVDHQDSYSVKVCFPYRFDADDDLVIEDPYAVDGDYEIFEKLSN